MHYYRDIALFTDKMPIVINTLRSLNEKQLVARATLIQEQMASMCKYRNQWSEDDERRFHELEFNHIIISSVIR